MENQVTREQALVLLEELTNKTPSELWEMYPERIIFEEKIVVEHEKSKEDPIIVLKQLIDYLHIPKRKPWIVDMICQNIRKELNLPQKQKPDVLENY